MNWIIWAIIGVVLLLFVFKVSHLRHRLSIAFFVLLFLFLFGTFFLAIKGTDIDLKSASGIGQGVKIYFSWLGSSFGNIKALTTNAVDMDWSSNSSSAPEIGIREK
jgi:hypothetical protein